MPGFDRGWRDARVWSRCLSAAVDLERTGDPKDAELAHALRGLVAKDQARITNLARKPHGGER